jgi:hypothetical protein
MRRYIAPGEWPSVTARPNRRRCARANLILSGRIAADPLVILCLLARRSKIDRDQLARDQQIEAIDWSEFRVTSCRSQRRASKSGPPQQPDYFRTACSRRFRPLQVFGRRPSVRMASPVMGWHPKTFTESRQVGARKVAQQKLRPRTGRPRLLTFRPILVQNPNALCGGHDSLAEVV